MRRKAILLPILLLLLIPIAQSLEYYADLEIAVDDSGVASITGTTNHPALFSQRTEAYTFKERGNWLFNLTTDEAFSDFVYSVSLPPRASINYIKSSGQFRIEQRDGRIAIAGVGEDSPISIAIQYRIRPEGPLSEELILPALLLLAAIAAAAILLRRKKPTPKQSYDSGLLTPRQLRIVQALEKNGNAMTQAHLEKELGLPKASLSRNIASLELKGILQKEKVGMANLIRLKK